MFSTAWDRLQTIFSRRSEARQMARRWRRAAQADPQLRNDVLALGGVLSMQSYDRINGVPELAPIDPLRLAFEAGRRELALQLSALMDISLYDLKTMENDDEE